MMTLWQWVLAKCRPGGNGGSRGVARDVATTHRLVEEVRQARAAYREERAAILPSVGVVLERLRQESDQGGGHG